MKPKDKAADVSLNSLNRESRTPRLKQSHKRNILCLSIIVSWLLIELVKRVGNEQDADMILALSLGLSYITGRSEDTFKVRSPAN